MAGEFAPSDERLSSLPLAGLKIVEIANGKTDMCGRYLADLGAEVLLIEPDEGAPSRRREPIIDGVSLYFVTHGANKRSVVLELELERGRRKFLSLIDSADIFIDSTRPGTLARYGLDPATLRARRHDLIVLSISEFGLTGPYREYEATNSIHIALSGTLCRSGQPDMEPLLPPGSLAYESAAVHAAWCAMLAYWQRLQTGTGDHLDVSIYEASTQLLDPPLGMSGSAWAGQSALEATSRGRPPPWPLYPIFPCADGFVRISTLNPRQWAKMSEWLGPSHEFVDPSYGILSKRMSVIGRVNELIGAMVRDRPAGEIVEEAQRRGIAAALVATPGDVLQNEHFRERGAMIPIEVAPGLSGIVPSGYVEINGVRCGIRTPAPALGANSEEIDQTLLDRDEATTAPAAARPEKPVGRRPLEGIRILDFGIIVAGAELGRILADQGAEVIKVETRAFPDGVRQDLKGRPINPSFALGSRNKLSLGINLKSDRGCEIFKQLVEHADIVLSNFKPGTLESLGLGYDVLKAINPRIVMLDSSALGKTGPLSRSMGYGPLVRATSGLTYLWRYTETDASFSDGVTVYPDHLASRVGAVAVMALLISRERTGIGGTASVAQAETFLTSFSEHFLHESLSEGAFGVRGNVPEFNAPDGVFPCAGDDEWCVVSVRNDAEWQRLAEVIGRPDLLADGDLATARGRLGRRDEISGYVAEWTKRLSPREVTRLLQEASVPAGHMHRLKELADDPQLCARNFFRILHQPGLDEPLPAENGPVKALHIPDPDIRPAPLHGEHTRLIVERLLGMSGEEIDALIAAGDLEETLPARNPQAEPATVA